MDDKLKKFNSWLLNNCPGYVSMVAEGSVATDDYWIENRSDYDIFIIFKDNYKKNFNKIHEFLNKSDFEEHYKFSIYSLNSYLSCKRSPYDFSTRFRGRVLFGAEILRNKKMPTREMTKTIYLKGLANSLKDLESCILSSNIWGLRKLRDVFWEQYKKIFMFLAIKIFYEMGEFPSTREDVAKKLDSEELKNTLIVLNKIDSMDKEDIIINSENLFKYLNRLEVK